MQNLIIYNIKNSKFLHEALKNLMLNLSISELNTEEFKNILNYIFKNYKITKDMIIASLINNVEIIQIQNKTVIRINPKAYILKTAVKLTKIIRLINYGNLEIHGTYFYNKLIAYIQQHIDSLYAMYLCQGGQGKLWELDSMMKHQ